MWPPTSTESLQLFVFASLILSRKVIYLCFRRTWRDKDAECVSESVKMRPWGDFSEREGGMKEGRDERSTNSLILAVPVRCNHTDSFSSHAALRNTEDGLSWWAGDLAASYLWHVAWSLSVSSSQFAGEVLSHVFSSDNLLTDSADWVWYE